MKPAKGIYPKLLTKNGHQRYFPSSCGTPDIAACPVCSPHVHSRYILSAREYIPSLALVINGEACELYKCICSCSKFNVSYPYKDLSCSYYNDNFVRDRMFFSLSFSSSSYHWVCPKSSYALPVEGVLRWPVMVHWWRPSHVDTSLIKGFADTVACWRLVHVKLGNISSALRSLSLFRVVSLATGDKIRTGVLKIPLCSPGPEVYRFRYLGSKGL